jgi:hypothetical protein
VAAQLLSLTRLGRPDSGKLIARRILHCFDGFSLSAKPGDGLLPPLDHALQVIAALQHRACSATRRLERGAALGQLAGREAIDLMAQAHLGRRVVVALTLHRIADVVQRVGYLATCGPKLGVDELCGGDGVDVGDLAPSAERDQLLLDAGAASSSG